MNLLQENKSARIRTISTLSRVTLRNSLQLRRLNLKIMPWHMSTICFFWKATDTMGNFTGLLLQILLARLVYSDHLLNFITIFKGEATALRQHCTSWVDVFDSHTASNILLENGRSGITLIVESFITSNQSNKNVQKFKFGLFHHHQPCSLVSINLTHMQLQTKNPTLTSFGLVLDMFPGHPHHVYNLLWLQSSARQQLPNITASLVTLPNAFIILQQDDIITILTRNLNPNHWYEASKYKMGATKLQLNIQAPNFNGSPVLATVCAVCASAVEYYKNEGIWRDAFIGTIFIFTTKFNGTLELEGVFSLPQDGPNEDGEWDDWVTPTLDGTAVFASVVKRSYENRQIVYHTTYVFHDSVTFTTARPKRIQYSVIQKLYRPLSSGVWLAILISLVAVVGSIEILIHLRFKLTPHGGGGARVRPATGATYLVGPTKLEPRREKHEHANTVHAILEPFVDQSGLRSLNFNRNIRHVSARILVGLWFLLVIVLNSGYKSMMTSLMVRPVYSNPPTTFRELLESDYHIGCTFYEGTIDVSLELLNNSMSRSLMRRIQPYSYYEPECYRIIFEGENACIGLRQVFNGLGLSFMVDVHYQNMAVFSKENIFPIALGMGVSRHYPVVAESIGRFIRVLSESGVYEKWWDNGRWFQLRTGQANAKSFAQVKSYYLGLDDSMKQPSDETLQLFVQVFGYGSLVATSAFLVELLYHFAVIRLH